MAAFRFGFNHALHAPIGHTLHAYSSHQSDSDCVPCRLKQNVFPRKSCQPKWRAAPGTIAGVKSTDQELQEKCQGAGSASPPRTSKGIEPIRREASGQPYIHKYMSNSIPLVGPRPKAHFPQSVGASVFPLQLSARLSTSKPSGTASHPQSRTSYLAPQSMPNNGLLGCY